MKKTKRKRQLKRLKVLLETHIGSSWREEKFLEVRSLEELDGDGRDHLEPWWHLKTDFKDLVHKTKNKVLEQILQGKMYVFFYL